MSDTDPQSTPVPDVRELTVGQIFTQMKVPHLVGSVTVLIAALGGVFGWGYSWAASDAKTAATEARRSCDIEVKKAAGDCSKERDEARQELSKKTRELEDERSVHQGTKQLLLITEQRVKQKDDHIAALQDSARHWEARAKYCESAVKVTGDPVEFPVMTAKLETGLATLSKSAILMRDQLKAWPNPAEATRNYVEVREAALRNADNYLLLLAMKTKVSSAEVERLRKQFGEAIPPL